jgi:hypothetical protein
MNFNSPKTRVTLSAAKLFEWASNCQNFAHYLYDKVKVINTTADSCTFTVENITTVTLKIIEKMPFTSIRFVSADDKNIPFSLTLNFIEVSDIETDILADLDIELPVFLKTVLQSHLQRLMEILPQKIKIEAEKLGL